MSTSMTVSVSNAGRTFALIAFWAAMNIPGCADSGKMGTMKKADIDDKHVVVCRSCYDVIKKELAFVSKAPKSRGQKVYRTVKVHQCEECKTGAEFFEEDGVLKFRCSKCAPAGEACDKCAPLGKS